MSNDGALATWLLVALAIFLVNVKGCSDRMAGYHDEQTGRYKQRAIYIWADHAAKSVVWPVVATVAAAKCIFDTEWVERPAKEPTPPTSEASDE